MKTTYPHRFCPSALFQLNSLSRKLYEQIAKREGSLSEIAEPIFKILGYPNDLSEAGLIYWCNRYRDLCTPILTELFRTKGHEFAIEVHQSIFLKIAKTTLTKVISISTYPNRKELLAECLEQIENPWHMMFIQWHIFGRREYVVSSGLKQRLKQTKLRGYPSEDLKLPGDCIYIDLQNYGEFGSATPEGCLVVNFDDAIGIAIITKDFVHEFPRMLDINLGSHSLDEALKDALKRYQQLKIHSLEVKNFIEPWRQLFSYVVNVILYATMPDAEQQFRYYDKNYEKLQKRLNKLPLKSTKRQKVLNQLRKARSEGVHYLGGSIVVDRNMDAIGRQGSSRGQITVRTLVSGHWRSQPCGEGNLQRKRIWIEPFWRGPEGAPITQRQHNLR